MSGSSSNGQSMEIFTSLRYDPSTADSTNGPFYMLDYHRDRLQESATNFGYTNAVSRFEGSEGLDWLKESLTREVKSYQAQNAVEESTPLSVRSPEQPDFRSRGTSNALPECLPLAGLVAAAVRAKPEEECSADYRAGPGCLHLHWVVSLTAFSLDIIRPSGLAEL